MLFMGEEWNAAQPFPFFCDFQGDLADAVRAGRQAEFDHLPEFADPARRKSIPDPLSSSTFESAILHWEDRDNVENLAWLNWYRDILAARRAQIVPFLQRLTGGEACYFIQGPQAVTVQWLCSGGPLLRLNANLSESACGGFPPSGDFPPGGGREIWIEGRRDEAGVLQPWCVQWSIVRE
jgi:1,4-alpha-glucan branching enzyme/maltooligosyltrehalose trehalohydrolase